MNKKILTVVIIAVALCSSAYIYPTSFLLGKASEIWVQRPSMNVIADIAVYDANGTDLKATGKAEYAWNRQSDLRVDYTVNTVKESVLYKNEGATKSNPATLSGDRRHLIHNLFAALNKGKKAEGLLKEFGIDRKTSAFDRFEGQVCYIFGATEGETDKPQLWLEKDGMWPVKMQVFHGKERIELRFSQWQHPLMKGLFPRRIELYINNKLREVQTVSDIKTFVAQDPARFVSP